MRTMKRSPIAVIAVLGSFLMAVVAWISVTSPRSSEATPAYGRRYGTDCATCHSPLPPRLNNVGMVFRRAGFRMPDSDENGKLQLKTVAAHGIGDAASLSAQASARNDSKADPGTSRSTLALGEVELVAGTAVGDHYAAQMMFLPHTDAGGTELEDLEVQANMGSAEQQFILRAGKAQTFLWQKANHGGMTIAMPMLFDEMPAAPVGDFGGFSLGAKQVELEAGYMFTRLQKGKLMSTMFSAAALNGVDEAGSAAPRNTTDGTDVLLQALQLFGSSNTVGAFYYNGRTIVDPLGLLPTPGPFHDRFSRSGVLGTYSPIERFEIAAAGAVGEDRSDQLGRKVKVKGGYVEGTAEILSHWTGTYRWEQLDPDTDASGGLMRADVISTTCQLQESMFLTAEYQQVNQGGDKTHSLIGRVRFVY